MRHRFATLAGLAALTGTAFLLLDKTAGWDGGVGAALQGSFLLPVLLLIAMLCCFENLRGAAVGGIWLGCSALGLLALLNELLANQLGIVAIPGPAAATVNLLDLVVSAIAAERLYHWLLGPSLLRCWLGAILLSALILLCQRLEAGAAADLLRPGNLLPIAPVFMLLGWLLLARGLGVSLRIGRSRCGCAGLCCWL
jgi:hypothetical protein